jgi:DNA-binding transcriptional ArsR family regulator
MQTVVSRNEVAALEDAVSKEKLERVATIFRAFAEPTRLGLLQALRGCEKMRVSELVELSGTTQANVSKHLKVLHDAGVLTRQRMGNQTLYGIGDPVVVELLEAVCNKLNREAHQFANVEYTL